MTIMTAPKLDKPNQQNDDEIDLMHLVALLLDRKWWIVGITALGMLVGVAYALLATPIYQADALLQVEEKSSNLTAVGDFSELFPSSSSAAAEIQILRSRMIVGRVVDALSLDVQVAPKQSLIDRSIWHLTVSRFDIPPQMYGEEFTLTLLEGQRYRLHFGDQDLGVGTLGELFETPLDGAQLQLRLTDWRAPVGAEFFLSRIDRRVAIDQVQKQLSVSERGNATGILSLSYRGADPEQIRKILQAISHEYLLQNISRNAAEAEKGLEFLRTQLPEVKGSLDEAEQRLNEYRLQQGSVDIQLETQGLLTAVVALEKQISELSIKESELSRLYTREHPIYVALLEQRKILEDERQRLRDSTQNLPETQQEVLRLTRDVQVNQEIYVQMLNRIQELDIMRAGTVGNVRIIDDAMVAPHPVAPKKSLIVVLATVLAGMLGAGFALVMGAINKGIDSAQQLEQAGLTVYASVPLSQPQLKSKLTLQKSKKSETTFLLAKEQPTDLAIESLRGLRTSLHFALTGKESRVVGISGPSPEVGKSFISANLAVVLAQSGKRVLLIDGDMRRGYLHRLFALTNEQGLSDYLRGQDVKPAQTEVEGLDVLSRGNVPPNPSELLMGPAFEHLLQWAQSEYDLILVDTPPLLAVTDAALITRYASVNLLITRFARTTVRETLLTVQRFNQNGIEIHGVVLNALEQTARNTYAYGGYHYAYQYRSKSA